MSAAAPWSVKGIDPKAREIAKDLARRSGMTLGEWLNTMILEDDDDGVTPLPRRAHATQAFERRGRSRRIDDAYDLRNEREPERGFDYGRDPVREDILHRVAASVDAIAARLEAAERRSTVAIQGVDQAVAGLLRRLDGQDEATAETGRRIDDIAEELREGHRRLRAFEKEVGPKTAESFTKMETSIAAVTSRLYDIEERQRLAGVDLRQRMQAVEMAIEATPTGAPTAEVLSQVTARLDQAQAQTGEALRSLERSFAGLDQRLREAEGRVEPEGAREAARFEKLAESLSRQVEASRGEMMRRLDTVETEGRLERIERAVASIGEQAAQAERRAASAVDAMGREVLKIAENLNGRMAGIETGASGGGDPLALERTARVERDMGRLAQTVEQRLNRTDDQNAIALEKLGAEITRISDRLGERIIQSERRSVQALEDIGRRLSEDQDRTDQRHERSSGEMAERLRLSEERTTRLIAEARERLDTRVQALEDRPASPTAPVAAAPAAPRQAGPFDGDWRATAFPGESFDPVDDGWSRDPLDLDLDPVQPAAKVPEPEPIAPSADLTPDDDFSPVVVPELTAPEARVSEPVFGKAGGFAAFGGADVSDALEATGDAPAPDDVEDFAGETDFVDANEIRAQMASAAAAGRAGRSASTQSAIDAARAAMAESEAAPTTTPAKSGFSLLRRGGKSKLQERLDKQASKAGGSTVKKAFLASAIGVAAVTGILATGRLTGVELSVPNGEPQGDVLPIAAMAMAPVPAAVSAETVALYDEGLAALEAGDEAGLDAVTEAANLGHAPAQLKLVELYQVGASGVPQDEAESRVWARRAAEGGDPRGMHAYAMYLFDGVGGRPQKTEALTWLERAGAAGLIDSQYNAARIHEQGDDGIAADPVQALTWYTVAARSGDAQAEAAVQRLSPTLSAENRRVAQSAAAAIQPTGQG